MDKIKEAIKQLEDLKKHCESVQDIDDCADHTLHIKAIDTVVEAAQENIKLKRLLELAIEDLGRDSTICERCKNNHTDECEPIEDGSCHIWRYADKVKGLIENGS